MKRDIVTEKLIQNTEQIRDFEYWLKEYNMNNAFNSNYELQFYKTKLNYFSYYFHTC